MIRCIREGLCTVALGLALSGCGGDDSGPSGPPPLPDFGFEQVSTAGPAPARGSAVRGFNAFENLQVSWKLNQEVSDYQVSLATISVANRRDRQMFLEQQCVAGPGSACGSEGEILCDYARSHLTCRVGSQEQVLRLRETVTLELKVCEADICDRREVAVKILQTGVRTALLPPGSEGAYDSVLQTPRYSD